MTTKSLQGLTIAQIKNQFPNGKYLSSMKKDAIIKAALASEKPVKTGHESKNVER